MNSNFRKIWYIITFLIIFMFFLRVNIYSQNTFPISNWIHTLEFVIPALEFFYFCLLLYYTYCLYDYYLYYSKVYWNFELFIHFTLYTLLVICVCLLLPGLLYINSMLILSDVFLYNSNEILQIIPNIKFSDFWILCMDGKQPDSTMPSMGGHIIAAGKYQGKEYVCVDLAEALHRYKPEAPNAVGAGQIAKQIFSIPDVACAGLDKSELPASNQSKK